MKFTVHKFLKNQPRYKGKEDVQAVARESSCVKMYKRTKEVGGNVANLSNFGKKHFD